MTVSRPFPKNPSRSLANLQKRATFARSLTHITKALVVS